MSRLEYPNRIIHISDVHCTTRDYLADKNMFAIGGAIATFLAATIPIPFGNPVRGKWQDSRAKCQELVAYLEGKAPVLRSNTILITGDLIDGAEDASFCTVAREYLLDPLQSLGYRVMLVPGNHDYFNLGNQITTGSIAAGRERFFEAFSTFLMIDTPGSYPVDVELGGGNHLVLLDSLKGHYDVSTDASCAQGNVGAQQMAWLQNFLTGFQQARWGGAKVAIALHHSPFDTGSLTELADGPEFLEVIRGRVDALLFGHVGPPQQFYADQSEALDIPIVNSENIDPMEANGYSLSVVDLALATVEVYSTAGGIPTTHSVGQFVYGGGAEAALVEAALDAQ
jgi:3',5'-cyclic AMP phosphodiesterase CpdA